MSLWKQINTCGPDVVEKIKQYYREKGLGDIRGYLAPWIEERILSELNAPNLPEAYELRARKFQEDLKKQLVCSELLVKQFKVLDLAQITSSPPVELYSHVRNGLQKEFQMLEQMQSQTYMNTGNTANNTFGTGAGMSMPYMSPGANPMGNAMTGLMGNMPLMGAMGGMQYGGGDNSNNILNADHVQWFVHEIDTLMQTTTCFKNELDIFHQYYANFRQNRARMEPQTAQQNEIAISERANTISLHSKKIMADVRRATDEYCKLQETVINQLKTWQHHQALAGNGATHKDNLDFIQRCVEMLMDFLEKLIDIINVKLSTKFDGVIEITEQLKRLRHSQEMLIASAFIVEKQPPQVMKTNTKFAAGVRWLIGNRLGVSNTRPQVECHILSEAQAKAYSQHCNLNNTNPQSSGEITSHCVTMDYTEATGVFFASFNMSLKKIRRAEKKGTESVMDEKFTLLFKTSCLVNGYQITVWTISLPVVVIVHGNQEPQSWATITWDNAFAEIGREPFQVPEKVSWSLLAATLNTKFASVTQHGLTEENLSFLRDKLFCNDIASTSQVDHKEFITWTQFCKDHLRGRNFTFWDWFYAIIKLTKDHFLGLWRAGLVYGFIDKARTIEILSSQPSGTFLLRFSDSTMGGISVAFVDDTRQVLMLEPWIARDLNILGLADRIRDIQALRYLYNLNMTRDEAFKEFYTQRNEDQPHRGDGYVPNSIRVNVPAIEGGSLQATPQHQMQSPPHPQDMQVSEAFGLNIHDLEDMLYSYGSDKPLSN